MTDDARSGPPPHDYSTLPRACMASAARLIPRVVGIGASAGGLQAFSAFLRHMPPDSGMAFVLIQHLAPQQPSLMPKLLAAHTVMPVHPVITQTPAAPNHVYIIPPNTALTIAQGVLHPAPLGEAHAQHLLIDHFFRSLAADQGEQAVGIVLSGIGADGSLGLAAIKQRGGLTLAQTPNSAPYPSMSQQAIAHGVVDHVLEITIMPTLLLARCAPSLATQALPMPAPTAAERRQDTLAQDLQHTPAAPERTIRDPQEEDIDLIATNEELRLLNEELQATNEELQTSKEEIQSINEELQTVNAELSRKIEELDRANADIANFFASTQIPAIFLRADGRIARFTPQATELFALIDTDVGRPISDLKAHFSNDDLRPLITQALQTLAPVEAMVHQPANQRWWNLQVRPYRTLADQIDGVVITFLDITALKQAEAMLQGEKDALELRVAARTQDLAAANAELQTQIAEREHSEQARQQLLHQLITAQEEERRHIARELHDQLGQDLTALILGLKALQERAVANRNVKARAAQLQAMAMQMSKEVRNLAVQLRPSALDDLGLELALSNYIEQWSVRAHVGADLHSSGLARERMPLAVETTIYRIVQESLTNVLKHAKATEVSVIIERKANEVQLIIEDDGVGFTTPSAPTAPDAVPQLGLIGMQERVALLDGSLIIESAPGSGTTIFAHIPLPHTIREDVNGKREGVPRR